MRDRVSHRSTLFRESVIREMTRVARAHDAINLAQGFPDFAMPESMKEAAAAAIHASNDYASAVAAVAFCGFVAPLIAYSFAPEKLQPVALSPMLAALRRCAGEHGGIDSLGVNTWGVDFALLGRDGTLLGNPRHYRDPRTERGVKAMLAKVPWETVFSETGIQFMPINALFQLAAETPERLASAARG